MSHYTPGPWSIAEDEHVWMLFGGPNEVGFAPQILKAPKRNREYAPYWPEESDARLIAAAPDLLKALEDLIDTCRSLATRTTPLSDREAVALMTGKQMTAAILAVAKARGEVDET